MTAWKVPTLPSSREWRALHTDFVRSLALVNGTGSKACTSDYDNVMAIVDVLDVYRTLEEMARACFGRLGDLLTSDQAREATKVADVRIMEHALWALKTYNDDVDMQLVSLCHRRISCRTSNDPPGIQQRSHDRRTREERN